MSDSESESSSKSLFSSSNTDNSDTDNSDTYEEVYKELTEFQKLIESNNGNLTEEIIQNNLDKLDLSELLRNFSFSENFILENEELFDTYHKKYPNNKIWKVLAMFQKLNEDIIEKYKDKTEDWPMFVSMSEETELSNDFIRKHSDKINWEYVFEYQKLDESVLKVELEPWAVTTVLSNHKIKLDLDFIRSFNYSWDFDRSEYRLQVDILKNYSSEIITEFPDKRWFLGRLVANGHIEKEFPIREVVFYARPTRGYRISMRDITDTIIYRDDSDTRAEREYNIYYEETKYQKPINLNIHNEYILGWTGIGDTNFSVFAPTQLDEVIREDKYTLWDIRYNNENNIWDLHKID